MAPSTRACEVPKNPTPEERWKEELRRLATGYDERLQAAGIPEIKKEIDRKHFENLRREIKMAVLIAPDGLPAVVFGAGGLRDIPDELFHSPKFSEIVLVDLDLEVMREAVRERGLLPLLRIGKIRLLKADLSMLSPLVMQDVTGIIKYSPSLVDALEVLKGYFERNKNGGALGGIPAELKGERFGLVVSSMLVPNLGLYVKLAVDRLLAARFGVALSEDPLDGLLQDDETYMQYGIAMKNFSDQVDQWHLQLVNGLTDEDGVAFVAMILAVHSPLTIARQDVFVKYVGKRAAEADAFWGAGKNIVKSGFWLWFNRPDRVKGHFVRSLLLMPRHSRSTVVERKEDVTPYVRWQVEECFRWVEENLLAASL